MARAGQGAVRARRGLERKGQALGRVGSDGWRQGNGRCQSVQDGWARKTRRTVASIARRPPRTASDSVSARSAALRAVLKKAPETAAARANGTRPVRATRNILP